MTQAPKAKKARKPAKAKAKKVVKAKAKKPAKKAVKAKKGNGKAKTSRNGTNQHKKRTADPRKDTLLADAFKLLKRPKGATRAELLEALGWKAVSVQQITGNAAKIDKSERPFRYRL